LGLADLRSRASLLGADARELDEGDFAMTQQKDFKRVVRTRMQKTGESYTTARLHLVKNQEAPAPDYAPLAGLSDESVKKATGCAWEKWVFVLDKAGGREMSHRELTTYIREKYTRRPRGGRRW